MRITILALSFALALLRAWGHHENLFKDIAHVWVGLLLGLVIAGCDRKFNIVVLVVLTIVEVACAKLFGDVINLGTP